MEGIVFESLDKKLFFFNLKQLQLQSILKVVDMAVQCCKINFWAAILVHSPLVIQYDALIHLYISLESLLFS